MDNVQKNNICTCVPRLNKGLYVLLFYPDGTDILASKWHTELN
jgi:hypothetical protein